MAGLLASRDQLYALLDAAGIQRDRGAGNRLGGIPGVAIRPSTTWLAPVTVRRGVWRVSWDVMAVAGKQDAEGTLAELADLIVRVWEAFRSTEGAWSPPAFAAPSLYAQDGVDHLAAVATMSTHIDLGG